MISTSVEVYKVIDPSQRDAKWMDSCITSLRRDWRPIVNQITNAVNKDLLFSRQDMSSTIAMFKENGDFLKTKPIIPLPLLDNIKNALVEEITKNPPKMELKATDVTAFTDKQYDMILLRLKSAHEQIVNEINKKVGDPPELIGKDKFRTNIDDFYRMGLNPDDPEDVEFYEQNDFPKLKYEIAGQKLIDIILKTNRFDEDTVEDFVIDILADKVICMDIYVDQITGQIKYDYIYPETFYGIFGKKSDGTDDISKGYEKSVNVNEFLEKVGNEFDWDRDWRKLLWAINFRNGFTYTGFRRNNQVYDVQSNEVWCAEMGLQNKAPNVLDWTLAYTYEVYLGKIEFKVPEATETYLKRKGVKEPLGIVSYDYELTKMQERKGYEKESWYQQQVYQSYYIATSGISQWIFGWGKVPYQQLYGANDEYSSGSLWYYRKRGKSAVEVALPYIRLCNDAFYKMVWSVYEAHPDWEVYQIEELTEMAKIMYSQAGAIGQTSNTSANQIQSQLTKLIEYFRNNLVKLKAVPRIDGKPFPQLNNTPVTEKRGLDPIAIAMQSVCIWAETQLKQKIGWSELREGNASARQGKATGEMETQASMNVTGYMYRMIQYQKQHVCTSTLNIAQDIVRYKDTLPYNWIKKLLGIEEFENLKILENFASHRYALMFQNYNAQLEKQTFIELVRRSLDSGDGRGGLNAMEAGLLLAEEDYKMGMKKLTYFKYKAEKKKRKQDLENMKIQQENMMAQKAADKELEKMKIDGKLAETKMITDAQKYVADRNNETKVQVKDMQHTNEPVKQQARADENIRVENNKANLDNQKSLI